MLRSGHAVRLPIRFTLLPHSVPPAQRQRVEGASRLRPVGDGVAGALADAGGSGSGDPCTAARHPCCAAETFMTNYLLAQNQSLGSPTAAGAGGMIVVTGIACCWRTSGERAMQPCIQQPRASQTAASSSLFQVACSAGN